MTFYALERPAMETNRDNAILHLDGTISKWYVETILDVEPFHRGMLRNDNSVVTPVYKQRHQYYFLSQSSAHYAAAMYYIGHNRIYPYMDEWQEALANGVGTVIQSEEFKF